MNIAIVGSRSFTDEEKFYSEIQNYVTGSDTIVSGGARGADTLAQDFASEHNIPTLILEADWRDFSEPCVKKEGKYGPYNALAGHKRNSTIVEKADMVVAFWDGESSGTKDTIEKARKADLPVIIVNV